MEEMDPLKFDVYGAAGGVGTTFVKQGLVSAGYLASDCGLFTGQRLDNYSVNLLVCQSTFPSLLKAEHKIDVARDKGDHFDVLAIIEDGHSPKIAKAGHKIMKLQSSQRLVFSLPFMWVWREDLPDENNFKKWLDAIKTLASLLEKRSND